MYIKMKSAHIGINTNEFICLKLNALYGLLHWAEFH